MMRQPSLLQSASVQLAIVGTLALAGIWWLGVRPAEAKLRAAAADRTALLQTGLENSAKKSLLAAAEEKYATLNSDLAKLQGVIPEASDTGSFVSALEEIAARSGTQIQSMSTKVQPKTATSAADASRAASASRAAANKTIEQQLLQSFYGTTIEVKVSGSYGALRSFVQQIRQMERFVSIASINLSADRQTDTGAGLLQGTISMSIFHRQPAKDITP